MFREPEETGWLEQGKRVEKVGLKSWAETSRRGLTGVDFRPFVRGRHERAEGRGSKITQFSFC